MNKKEKLIFDVTSDFLISKGFLKRNQIGNIFTRYKNNSIDKIGISLLNLRDENVFLFQFWLEKRVSQIECYWEDYRYLIGLENQPPPLTFIYNTGQTPEEDKKNINVKRVHKINYVDEKFENNLVILLNKVWKSIDLFFNTLSSIKFIDNLLNSPISRYEDLYYVVNPYGLIYRKIIVSFLAKNPKYQELCNLMLEKIKSYKNTSTLKNNLLIYNKLIASLNSKS